jgi:hypothetical protein
LENSEAWLHNGNERRNFLPAQAARNTSAESNDKADVLCVTSFFIKLGEIWLMIRVRTSSQMIHLSFCGLSGERFQYTANAAAESLQHR